MASASVMPAARTVSVQVAPAIALSSGFSTTLDAGLAVTTVKLTGEVAGHSRSKLVLAALAVVSKLTDSLKLMVMLLVGSTDVAESAGVVVVTLGAASTLKVRTKFAAILFGGSLRSVSLTWAATTVNEHAAPCGKPPVGVSVIVLVFVAGKAGTLLKGTPAPQFRVKALAVRSTFSLKLTVSS